MIFSALIVFLYLIDAYQQDIVNIILKKIYLLTIGMLIPYQITWAQTEFSNNNNYDHFLLNPGAIIPSTYSNSQPTLNMLYRSRTGLLKDISNIYTDFVLKGNKSYGGVKLFSQRETRLFAHSKVLLLYGIDVALSTNVHMSTSAQIGASNVFFGASQASGGSGSWLIDGGISVSIVGERWNISAMINQIPNGAHDFINAQLLLSRYYESIIIKKWQITKDWSLQSGVHTTYLGNELYFNLDSKVDYMEYGSLLLGIQNFRSFSGGFKVNIPNQNNLLGLIFSHRFGNTSNPLNSSANTVGLSYRFAKKPPIRSIGYRHLD